MTENEEKVTFFMGLEEYYSIEDYEKFSMISNFMKTSVGVNNIFLFRKQGKPIPSSIRVNFPFNNGKIKELIMEKKDLKRFCLFFKIYKDKSNSINLVSYKGDTNINIINKINKYSCFKNPIIHLLKINEFPLKNYILIRKPKEKEDLDFDEVFLLIKKENPLYNNIINRNMNTICFFDNPNKVNSNFTNNANTNQLSKSINIVNKKQLINNSNNIISTSNKNIQNSNQNPFNNLNNDNNINNCINQMSINYNNQMNSNNSMNQINNITKINLNNIVPRKNSANNIKNDTNKINNNNNDNINNYMNKIDTNKNLKNNDNSMNRNNCLNQNCIKNNIQINNKINNNINKNNMNYMNNQINNINQNNITLNLQNNNNQIFNNGNKNNDLNQLNCNLFNSNLSNPNFNNYLMNQFCNNNNFQNNNNIPYFNINLMNQIQYNNNNFQSNNNNANFNIKFMSPIQYNNNNNNFQNNLINDNNDNMNNMDDNKIDIEFLISDIFKEQKNIFFIVGLKNVGLTCYMNSALQCLLHISELNYFFINTYPTKKDEFNELNKDVETKGKLSEQYYFLVKDVLEKNKEAISKKQGYFIDDYSVSPKYFNYVLSNLNDQFSRFAANDSKDLLLYLFQSMHAELNYLGDQKLKKVPKCDQTKENESYNFFMSVNSALNLSIISYLFYGILKSVTKCNICQTELYNFQYFQFLSFPIYNFKNKDFNIYQGFKEYIKPESMTGDNQCYCNICKKLNDAEVTTKLFYTPPYLIINFDYGKDKKYMPRKITFAEIIDLTSFTDEKCKSKTYELIAVSTHIGRSGNTGHYIAYCKDLNTNIWHKFNDSSHDEKCDFEKEVTSNTPYFLIYKKL